MDYFTGTGSTTVYQLSYTPASTTAILVFIGGVKQVASNSNPAYYLNGSQLIFASPPAGGSPIEIHYLGVYSQVNVPSNQSITTSMLSLTLANSFTTQVTANGTGNTITLTAPPVSANSLIVTANGVVQYDYTVNNTQLLLGFTPPAGTLMRVTALALAQSGVPNDGSVTTSKLARELILSGNTTFVGGNTIAVGPIYSGLNSQTPLGGATNPVAGGIQSANNYIQTYVYNTNTGGFASADFTAYPNNGNDSSGWVDMGITSQNFNQAAYSVTGPNEGYILMSAPYGSSTSGNLVFATDSTGINNSFQWYGNGFAQAKNTTPLMTLDGKSGNLLIGTPSSWSPADNQKVLIHTTAEGGTAYALHIINDSYVAGRARISMSPRYSFAYNTSPYIESFSESTSAAALIFGTTTGSTASERARIDSSGNFVVGSSNTNGRINSYVSGNANYFYMNDGTESWKLASVGTGLLQIGSGTTSNTMTFDRSGNLGIGVTPNTWYLNTTAYKALQMGASAILFGTNTPASGNLTLYTNGYLDTSAVPRYQYSSWATKYDQTAGTHAWSIAPSGTAGNPITFTQAMTLDASGNLGIGTSSPANLLTLYKASYPYLQFWDQNTGTTSSDGFRIGYETGTGGYIDNLENTPVVFRTNGAERMRIDTSGKVSISVGPASATNLQAQLQISPPTLGAAPDSYANFQSFRVSNSSTTDKAWTWKGSPNKGLVLSYYSESDSFVTEYQRLTLDNNGYVGIGGATTPRTEFDLSTGRARFNNYLAIGHGPNNNDGLFFNITPSVDGSTYTPGYIGTTGAGSAFIGMPSGGNGGLMLKVYRHGTSSATYTESAMTLSTYWDDQGNVGIGTNSLGAKFHVAAANASVQARLERTGTSTGYSEIGGDSGNFYIWPGGYAANKPTVFDTSGNLKFNSGYGSAATAYGCRAWVNFNGTGTNATNQTMRGNGGVTSVYKNGAGDYTVNLAFTMPDANYVTNVTSAMAGICWAGIKNGTTPTTTAVNVAQRGTSTFVDDAYMQVSIFR